MNVLVTVMICDGGNGCLFLGRPLGFCSCVGVCVGAALACPRCRGLAFGRGDLAVRNRASLNFPALPSFAMSILIFLDVWLFPRLLRPHASSSVMMQHHRPRRVSGAERGNRFLTCQSPF